MRGKSVVLLSAGLDSTVNLAQAVEETEVKMALTFDYGQRAAQHERAFSKKIAEYYKVPHRIIELPWLKGVRSALTDVTKAIPKIKIEDLDDKKKMKLSAKLVWVPNRNGIFINIAAGFAEFAGANLIVAGFNAEEGATFPDNSHKFVKAANTLLQHSTLNIIEVISYTQHEIKSEIASRGLELGIPFQYIWSCYGNSPMMCGKCEPCTRLIAALKNVHALDLLKGRMTL